MRRLYAREPLEIINIYVYKPKIYTYSFKISFLIRQKRFKVL